MNKPLPPAHLAPRPMTNGEIQAQAEQFRSRTLLQEHCDKGWLTLQFHEGGVLKGEIVRFTEKGNGAIVRFPNNYHALMDGSYDRVRYVGDAPPPPKPPARVHPSPATQAAGAMVESYEAHEVREVHETATTKTVRTLSIRRWLFRR